MRIQLYQSFQEFSTSLRVITTDSHPATILVEGEQGLSSVPKGDRRWLKIKNQYIGALSFTAKPGGFVNTRQQLRYLWEVLCRSHVVDTEMVCQITAANSLMMKTDIQRILKQGNVTAQNAAQKLSIDVGAHIKTKRSELYSNWLLDSDRLYTYCRYYPSPVQLATVANNPDEQAAAKVYLPGSLH